MGHLGLVLKAKHAKNFEELKAVVLEITEEMERRGLTGPIMRY